MANEFRGEIELVSGEDKLRLVFDANAFCYAEEAMDGATTDDMIDMLRSGRVGFRLVRAILYGGLQANHPCHLMKAGEILGKAGLEAGRNAAIAGFKAAFAASVAEEEDATPGEAKAAGGSGTG